MLMRTSQELRDAALTDTVDSRREARDSRKRVAGMANAGDGMLFGYLSDVFVFTFLSITAEVFIA